MDVHLKLTHDKDYDLVSIYEKNSYYIYHHILSKINCQHGLAIVHDFLRPAVYVPYISTSNFENEKYT